MPTILIVDDEPSVHHLIRRALEHRKVDVITAATASDALAKVDSAQPDLVLLDVVLPDGSGLDLVGQPKQRDSRLPVIIVTALDTSDTAIEAMKLGAFDYLHKPIDVERLESMTDEAHQSRRMMTVPVAIDDMLSLAEHDAFVGHCEPMQNVFNRLGESRRRTSRC